MTYLIIFLSIAFLTIYDIYKMNKLVNIFIDFIDDKIKDSDELKDELIKFKKSL